MENSWPQIFSTIRERLKDSGGAEGTWNVEVVSVYEKRMKNSITVWEFALDGYDVLVGFVDSQHLRHCS